LAQSAIDDDSTVARGRHRKPRARVFWRFWGASAISGAGTAITTVALPLLAVLTLKATSIQVGVLAACTYVAWLVIGLPAGVIVGHLPLRGCQVAMDLIRAAAIASIPIAAVLHVLTFAQLAGVALIVGFANVIFSVGNLTFLPSVVSKEQLTKRNSLMTGTEAAVQFGGPSVGGVLVQAIGAPASVVIDAVSYAVSAIMLQSIPRTGASPTVKTPGVPALQLIRDGWRYVMGHKIIRPCAIVATSVNMTTGALFTVTPLFLVRSLHTPPGIFGLILATDGLGSLLGASVATSLGARLGSARAIRIATTVSALSMLLLPLAGPGWALLLYAAGTAGFAAGVTVFSILTRTHRQTVTPSGLLSRVMATVRFVSWGAIPVGSLLAGVLATVAGNRAAVLLVAIPTVLAPAVLWLSAVRRERDLA
jgi:MFS family permease